MDNLRKSMNNIRSALSQEPETTEDNAQTNPPFGSEEEESFEVKQGNTQLQLTHVSQSQTSNGGSSDSGRDSAIETQIDPSDSDNKPSSSGQSDHENVIPRLHENLFGNGWLGYSPVSHISPSQYKASTEGRLDSPLSVQIAVTAIRAAYDDLWSTTDISTPVIRQKFGYVLQYRTREEVLFKLRWCLGPGIAEIGRLAMAPFDELLGLDTENGSGYSVGEGAFMGPEVSAVDRKGYIRNANYVAKWIRQHTLTEVDHDILELDLDVFTPRQDGHLNGYTAQGFFDYPQERRLRVVQPVRVSKSLFLRNMSDIGFCLHIGPAFGDAELERVIQKSTLLYS